MKPMVQLITDSSADLPLELIEKYRIKVVPLSVRIGDSEYQERSTITPEEFHEKMFASDELPKTSQTSPRC
jgi:fatty acid-binding protein DegV